MKDRRKKAHINTEEQENFLERKKREIEKELDNAKYIQRVSEGTKRALSHKIKRLERPVGYNTHGVREMILYPLKRCLIKAEKAFNSATATIERLELCKKEMKDDPHKFLRKMGRL